MYFTSFESWTEILTENAYQAPAEERRTKTLIWDKTPSGKKRLLVITQEAPLCQIWIVHLMTKDDQSYYCGGGFFVVCLFVCLLFPDYPALPVTQMIMCGWVYFCLNDITAYFGFLPLLYNEKRNLCPQTIFYVNEEKVLQLSIAVSPLPLHQRLKKAKRFWWVVA